MRPGARQLIELQAAVEDPQVLGADKLEGNIHLRAEALAQYFVHRVEHGLLARGNRQHLHVQGFVVERDHEACAAHVA
ncbi:hypothetical protein D3C80_1021100 [compost metagenome]